MIVIFKISAVDKIKTTIYKEFHPESALRQTYLHFEMFDLQNTYSKGFLLVH